MFGAIRLCMLFFHCDANEASSNYIMIVLDYLRQLPEKIAAPSVESRSTASNPNASASSALNRPQVTDWSSCKTSYLTLHISYQKRSEALFSLL